MQGTSFEQRTGNGGNSYRTALRVGEKRNYRTRCASNVVLYEDSNSPVRIMDYLSYNLVELAINGITL